MESRVTVKGQMVIPARIRRRLGIRPGTRVQLDVDEASQRIILTPVTREFVAGLRGKYRGKGLLAALAAEKKRERQR